MWLHILCAFYNCISSCNFQVLCFHEIIGFQVFMKHSNTWLCYISDHKLAVYQLHSTYRSMQCFYFAQCFKIKIVANNEIEFSFKFQPPLKSRRSHCMGSAVPTGTGVRASGVLLGGSPAVQVTMVSNACCCYWSASLIYLFIFVCLILLDVPAIRQPLSLQKQMCFLSLVSHRDRYYGHLGHTHKRHHLSSSDDDTLEPW